MSKSNITYNKVGKVVNFAINEELIKLYNTIQANYIVVVLIINANKTNYTPRLVGTADTYEDALNTIEITNELASEGILLGFDTLQNKFTYFKANKH